MMKRKGKKRKWWRRRWCCLERRKGREGEEEKETGDKNEGRIKGSSDKSNFLDEGEKRECGGEIG